LLEETNNDEEASLS